jgi:hypothetical protein
MANCIQGGLSTLAKASAPESMAPREARWTWQLTGDGQVLVSNVRELDSEPEADVNKGSIYIPVGNVSGISSFSQVWSSLRGSTACVSSKCSTASNWAGNVA